MARNILLLLIITVLTPFITSISAQQNKKFHVQSFEQAQFDTSARDKATEKIDGNGDRYAIIKVTSTKADDDLLAYNFDFGMMNSLIEQHDDELWVYVQRNAKHVTIKRAGYNPVRNYNLQVTVQPGQVFNMVLSPEAEKIQKQVVRFNIVPAASKAVIMYYREGKSNEESVLGYADENGSVAKSLPLGTYIYNVKSENWHTSDGRIVLNGKEKIHIENVTLRPNFANIELKVNNNVDIYIDDEHLGTGKWQGTLKPGSYNIECRKQSHKSSFETITVVEGENISIDLKSPTPIIGSLSIVSTPLDAQVTIDGKSYGLTPVVLNDLLIGNHKVTLSKQGYATTTVDIVINEGETTEQEIRLKSNHTTKNNTVAGGATTAVDINTNIAISKPRDPNELLCIACNNIYDGSLSYFNKAEWEALTKDEKLQYEPLGISIRELGNEFIIATSECNDGKEMVFGGWNIDFAGIKGYDYQSVNVKQKFINTGYSDTKRIIEQAASKNKDVPAAKAAWNYRAHGCDKSQWYLPSISEWKIIYKNIKEINEFIKQSLNGSGITDFSYSFWSSTRNENFSFYILCMHQGLCFSEEINSKNKVLAVTKQELVACETVSANDTNNDKKPFVISNARKTDELLCIACINKEDGTIAYFTGREWKKLNPETKSQYAQLGVSFKKDKYEFIIAAKDCNDNGLDFGACGVNFVGVENRKYAPYGDATSGYLNTKRIVEQQRGKKDYQGIVGAPAAEAAWSYKANEYDKLQWYLPGFGELIQIRLHKKEINKFLKEYIDGASEIKVNKKEIWTDYWSCSEADNSHSWSVQMENNDYVNYPSSRSSSNRVRAITSIK